MSNNPRNGWITVRPATGAEFNVRAGMVDEILAKVAGDSAVASSGLPAVQSSMPLEKPADGGEETPAAMDAPASASSLPAVSSSFATTATDVLSTTAMDEGVEDGDSSASFAANPSVVDAVPGGSNVGLKQPRGRAPRDHTWDETRGVWINDHTGAVRASAKRKVASAGDLPRKCWRPAQVELSPDQASSSAPVAGDLSGCEVDDSSGAGEALRMNNKGGDVIEELDVAAVSEAPLDRWVANGTSAIGVDAAAVASIGGGRAKRAAATRVNYNESDSQFWENMSEKLADFEDGYEDASYSSSSSWPSSRSRCLPLGYSVVYVRPDDVPPPRIPVPAATAQAAAADGSFSSMAGDVSAGAQDQLPNSQESSSMAVDANAGATVADASNATSVADDQASTDTVSSFRLAHKRQQYAEPEIGDRVLKFFVGFGRYEGTIVSFRDAPRTSGDSEANRDLTITREARAVGLKPPGNTVRFYRVEFDDGDAEEYELEDVKVLMRFHKEPQQLETLLTGGLSMDNLPRGSGRGAKASALDAIPVDVRLQNRDTKIVLLQDNPKKSKTKSWAR